ncbi:unnamed protein product [Sphagnum balticum]
MFESWIQKQSGLGNNKENMDIQAKKTFTQDLSKKPVGSKKIVLSTKVKEADKKELVKIGRANGELNRQKEQQFSETGQYSRSGSQVMLKSSGEQEKFNVSQMGHIRSPHNFKDREGVS